MSFTNAIGTTGITAAGTYATIWSPYWSMPLPQQPEVLLVQLKRVHVIDRERTQGIGYRTLCGLFIPPGGRGFLSDHDVEGEMCKRCAKALEASG